VKRLVALVAVAALAVSLAAVAAARTSSPPTMSAGKLVIGFGDPAVNFANGKIRGSNYLSPKGYEVDLASAIAKGLGFPRSGGHHDQRTHRARRSLRYAQRGGGSI